jgi:hypothetical protein
LKKAVEPIIGFPVCIEIPFPIKTYEYFARQEMAPSILNKVIRNVFAMNKLDFEFLFD